LAVRSTLRRLAGGLPAGWNSVCLASGLLADIPILDSDGWRL